MGEGGGRRGWVRKGGLRDEIEMLFDIEGVFDVALDFPFVSEPIPKRPILLHWRSIDDDG